MPEVITGKKLKGITVVKHIHLIEGSVNDILAGGYSNEMKTSLTPYVTPWIAKFNINRATTDPVLDWGRSVTGFTSDA